MGDFWNRERTISELIRHIGTMLSGEIYSTENTFNEEAASWFLANPAKLPFRPGNEDSAPENVAELQLEDFVESSEMQPDAVLDSEDELSLTLEPHEEEQEVSTIEDDDFMDDFQFPMDFPDAPTQSPTPGKKTKPTVDVNYLRQLAHNKNFHQLDKELNTLPGEGDFSGKEELFHQVTSALTEARALYEEAEDFENNGDAYKALECYKALENLVSDFPNIRADISRVEQAADLLRDINGLNGSSLDEPIEATQRSAKSPKRDASSGTIKKKARSVPIYEEKVKKTFNIIPFVLIGGLLCILAPLTYFYFTLSSHLTEARQLFSECTSNFSSKDFQAAEKACSASLNTTKNIYLIHQTEIAELQTGIRKIIDSEEMRQGLLGNVLYNERYISKTLLATHQSLQEMVSQGDTFLDSSAWDQAAASFQKALELCRQLKDLSPDMLLSIEQKLNYAAFRSMLTVAEQQVDKEEWSAAVTTLSELQAQVSKLSPEQQMQFREYIETLLAKSRFTTLKQQADTLFSQSDWTGAASLFQKAVEAGRSLSETEAQDLSGLKANITRAELYSTINAGNSAFASGQWDAAILQYTQAGSILDNNSEILNIQEVEQSRKKLDRIILQSAIIRDRQIAELSKTTEDIQKTMAHLQQVIDTIQGSAFANDPEFQEIISETRVEQKKLKDLIYLNNKEQYLINNYTTLFMENYPAATPETLSSPMADFVKKVGRRYLFKLQCTETGRGRPLKLIMYYTYNPDTNRWQFYSEN